MAGIFLSYRREDSAKYAVPAIREQLSQHFGPELVFRDTDSMDPGVDFVEEIERAVGSCDVLIAIVGTKWVEATDKQGNRRLENPKDWVRLEIETALNRKIRVVPALLEGVSMPSEEDLPGSLQRLARRHATKISSSRFRDDVVRLIQSLEKSVRLKRREGEDTQKAERAAKDTEELQERTVHAKPGTRKEKGIKTPEGMVRILKGAFLYGDDKRTVMLDKDYYIDIYPVTNEQYRPFFEAGGYRSREYWLDEGWEWKEREKKYSPEFWNDQKWNKPDHPVVGVSYYEAEAYAKWAGKRLPTEQEWEKAARGTDGLEYPWGDEFDVTKCNSRESGLETTTSITKYPTGVSPYGCYDMAGNVWEWCASWYDADKDRRVLRGGSWGNIDPVYLRSSYRIWDYTVNRISYIGFRLVQDIR